MKVMTSGAGPQPPSWHAGGLYLLVLLFPVLACLSVNDDAHAQSPKPSLKKGIFLVASPNLSDPNFRETVILICRHGSRGTMGLIVNQPSDMPLSEALPSIPALKGKSHTLFVGGPVRPRGLLMLFRAEERAENTQHVFDGVYWGGNLEMVQRMATQPKHTDKFRVFGGHAGWSHGQLESEIAKGAWIVVPANVESIFDKEPDRLWSDLVHTPAGRSHFISYQSLSRAGPTR